MRIFLIILYITLSITSYKLYYYYKNTNYRYLINEIESGKKDIYVDYKVFFRRGNILNIPKDTTVTIYSPDLITSEN